MFEYSVKQSSRARRISLAVHPDGKVFVIAPKIVGLMAATRQKRLLLKIDRFVKEKSGWVKEKIKFFERTREKRARKEKERDAGIAKMIAEAEHAGETLDPALFRPSNKADYFAFVKRARSVAEKRTRYFDQVYQLGYARISIKNSKSRWGSCSRRGNLNFSYKVGLLPSRLADYLIVHELCHRGEMNHGKKFWALVAQTIPDFKERRRDLKKIIL